MAIDPFISEMIHSSVWKTAVNHFCSARATTSAVNKAHSTA